MDLYSLKGKNILFFLVKNFGGYNLIIDKLKSYGANTIHYDERPASNNFTKGILRVAPRLIKNDIIKYYNSILKDLDKTKLDYVLVIRGEVVPAFFLRKIKEINPNCILIFYNWDSFKNTPNTSNHLDLYDKSFSFDLEDAKKFNINFLPLFYYDQFKADLNDSTGKKYDLLFLGTAHSDRYIIANKLSKWCETNGLTAFNYFFMQGKLVYFIKRIIDPTFKKFDYKKLSFNSLTTLEMVEFYKQSKVILDINHPYQTGLTMRTFEAIGANKKLITTNSEIKKYPFYNENNFYIIDREKLVLDKAFFEKDFQPLENSLYQKLSIEGWLESLFTTKNIEYWNKMLRN
ncbi:hypothetical protein [Chryseobacterium jejuense]|uniref:hypothetical protein n=1 Tax=Chryseobacterium jejuense TaxID=445960 RepID=UPI001AE79A3F|nr:hypothetical protein [Chryseobacterium jejuense]MBP2618037.1 hypothetical protein [Chryseobacterium jejuense]